MLDAVSLTGIQAGVARMDVVANTLTNLVTPGFKSARLDQITLQGGGTAVAGRTLDFSQGPVELDGGAFALAIQGDGFFQVDTPLGPRFTRDGGFRVDGSGTLVTADGLPVSPAVHVPPDAQSILVTRGGQVLVLFGDGTFQQVGQVGLSSFANPGGLAQEEGNLFAPTPASGPPRPGSVAEILSGALEGSNSDLAGEGIDAFFARVAVLANLEAQRVQDETVGELIDVLG